MGMTPIANKRALAEDGFTHLTVPLQDADLPVILMKAMAELYPVLQGPQLGCETMIDQVLIKMGMQEDALAIMITCFGSCS